MPLNYNKALDIALSYLSEADYVTECKDAFIFSIKDDLSLGGPTSPVVVLKEDGAAIGMTAFVDGDYDASIIRESYIKDWA